MPAVANVRVNTQVPFPALVVGSGGIGVTKVNGVWTITPGTLASTANANTWTQLQTFTSALFANGVESASFIVTGQPQTLSGTTGTVTTSNPSIIFAATGTFTATLPNPVGSPGLWLFFKNTTAQIINSASSNVVPLGSTTAGTAIFPATATKWGHFQSDNINWIQMAGN